MLAAQVGEVFGDVLDEYYRMSARRAQCPISLVEDESSWSASAVGMAGFEPGRQLT